MSTVCLHTISAHKWFCENGIVHRDLSAGNILLSRGGPVKGFITDLDMARVDDSLISPLMVQKAVDPVQSETRVDRLNKDPVKTRSMAYRLML